VATRSRLQALSLERTVRIGAIVPLSDPALICQPEEVARRGLLEVPVGGPLSDLRFRRPCRSGHQFVEAGPVGVLYCHELTNCLVRCTCSVEVRLFDGIYTSVRGSPDEPFILKSQQSRIARLESPLQVCQILISSQYALPILGPGPGRGDAGNALLDGIEFGVGEELPEEQGGECWIPLLEFDEYGDRLRGRSKFNGDGSLTPSRRTAGMSVMVRFPAGSVVTSMEKFPDAGARKVIANGSSAPSIRTTQELFT
jgi:hypothetical protein